MNTDDRLARLLPAARDVAAGSPDPRAVALARAVLGLAGTAGGRAPRERMTADTTGAVPACPACGRMFGSASSRGYLPEHGPVGGRCPGGLARVVRT